MSNDENFFRDQAAFYLAIELADYRAATTIALHGLRRDDPSEGSVWCWRFRGAFTRRHR